MYERGREKESCFCMCVCILQTHRETEKERERKLFMWVREGEGEEGVNMVLERNDNVAVAASDGVPAAAAAPMEEEDDLAAVQHRQKKLDDQSSALAEKLLQGWALLNEHCPQCFTPLVRNRQRKKYCVACLQWVMTQSEAAARISEQRAEEEKSSSQMADRAGHSMSGSGLEVTVLGDLMSQGALTTSASAVGANCPSIPGRGVENQEIPNGGNLERPASTARCSIETSFQRTDFRDSESGELIRVHEDRCGHRQPVLVLPKVDAVLTTETVLSNTLSVLVRKLEEIRRILAVTQNIPDMRQLFGALLDCLQAISHVKALGVS